MSFRTFMMWSGKVVGLLLMAVLGGLAGALGLASLHPGVKGPHISDGQLLAALAGGAVGGLVLGGTLWWLWHRVRKRRPPT